MQSNWEGLSCSCGLKPVSWVFLPHLVFSNLESCEVGAFVGYCDCGSLIKAPDESLGHNVRNNYKSYESLLTHSHDLPVLKFGSNHLEIISFMLDKLISNQANVFLDYGCGDGTLICELVRALGKEDNLFFAYDAYTSPNLPPEYDIEVLSKQMIDSPLYMEKFSSICLIHTLEHALFPGEMLMDIYNLLQPSGKLLIQVPNWKYNPFDLVIADHYHHFSIPTLCSLLLKSGFNVLHTGNEISWKEITVVAEKIVRREF